MTAADFAVATQRSGTLSAQIAEEQNASQPGLGARFLALVTMSTLAIALPLFTTIGDEATYFVVHGTGRLGIIAFTAALLAVPPVAVWLLCAALARRNDKVWGAGIGLFACLAVAPTAREMAPNSDAFAVAFILFMSACCAVLYNRHLWLRKALAYGSPLAIVLGGWFLGASDVAGLFSAQADAVVTAERSTETPIIWVTFDEFNVASIVNDDFEIDPKRAPNFARLAANSTWYRNATTSQPQTHKSIPSMLSGVYYEGEVPIPANWPNNAFSVLSGTYDTVAWEFASRLCSGPCDAASAAIGPGAGLTSLIKDTLIVYGHNVLPQGIRGNLPRIDDRWAGFGDPSGETSGDATGSDPATENAGTQNTGTQDTGAPKAATSTTAANSGAAGTNTGATAASPGSRANDASVTFKDIAGDIKSGAQARVQAWEAFTDRLGTDLDSKFLFFHALNPHEPLDFLPSGQSYTKTILMPGVNGGGTWLDDQYLADNQLQRYLLQVGYVDRMLGQLIDALENSGQWDDALVVIVADHGVSFQAGKPRRQPTPETFDDIARVPLFIKYPGQTEGEIDDRNVENVDIFPTVLDVVDIDADDLTLDGTSLLQTDRDRPDKRIWPYRNGGVPFVTDEAALPDELPFWTQAYALFGDGDGGLNPYAEGPYRALVGTKISEVKSGAAAPAAVALRRPELYRSIDLDAEVIPAFIAADVNGLADGTPMTVEFGDRIVATTQVFSDKDGGQHIGIMVNPEYLSDAEEGISFSVLKGDAKNPVRHPVK